MAKKKESKLERSLLLVSYILSLFGIKNNEYKGLSVLAEGIKDSWYEWMEDDKTSKFCNLVGSKLHKDATITKEDLLRYDANITKFTEEISQYRSLPIKWKYFQYLSLLFTEVYLDRYFSNKKKLLEDLNSFVDRYNNLNDEEIPNPDWLELKPYTILDLGKVAFWSATGSGKTLLMHIHIKQYLYYARKYKQDKHNKIILITPNEWLSQQHLKELKESGITASIFDKKQSSWLFSSHGVVILETSKLSDTDWDKTIAVDSFGDNNLVLIDEWHRGAWWEYRKKYRDQLSINWFAFEYSATFGQAIHATTWKAREELIQEYGKAILFDYSYKYFYHDGYGKEYRIFNITDDAASYSYKYLFACLLSYYQQHLIFAENTVQAKKFNIEKPLWIFVGSSVNAVRKEKWQNISDVVAIIQFFQKVFKDSKEAKKTIKSLLEEWLIDSDKKDIFAWAFSYIKKNQEYDIEEVYTDLLQKIFNTSLVWAKLHVDYLKWSDWEIGLRIWTSEYFGVINVWDSSSLFKLCLDNNIDGQEKDFSDSLFHNINHNSSSINLLIGSKKFTEWRSSRRVSTMGLMNIGKWEWSQIIQLFGRGVRLKWYNMSLKRSWRLDIEEKPEEIIPEYIQYLETLQVYGIKADYMQSFKEYLEREWLEVNDKAKIKITIPTVSQYNNSMSSIKILKKQDEYSFKRMHQFVLKYNELMSSVWNIEVDMYPKIQMMQSAWSGKAPSDEKKNEWKLNEQHLAFINRDYMFIELKKYKDEKRMFNIVIDKNELKSILDSNKRYTLFIPTSDLEVTSFEKISLFQDIVLTLLKKYLEKFFNTIKWQEEGKRLEIVDMTKEYTEKNFIQEYTILIDHDEKDLIDWINKMRDSVVKKTLWKEEKYKSNLMFLNMSEHLFYPLIRKDEKTIWDSITITPIQINDGERDFLVSLRDYIEKNSTKFWTKKIYVQRNLSKSWMWFFESQGFYPDFIMWILDGDKQFITFIDPKGIYRMWLKNEKILLHKKIKEKESELANPDVILNSFIVSNTPFAWVRDRWSKEQYAKSNVLFQEDSDYIWELFKWILWSKI